MIGVVAAFAAPTETADLEFLRVHHPRRYSMGDFGKDAPSVLATKRL
jgi:hypothetical protein